MESDQLFLAADAALRSVVYGIQPDGFDRSYPAELSTHGLYRDDAMHLTAREAPKGQQ